MSKRETLYAWMILLIGLILLGTAGALELGAIGLRQAVIQIGICVVVGLILSYLIWLEEARTARRGRNDHC